MRTALAAIVGAVIILGLLGCGTRQDDAYLRVMNGTPDSEELTVRVDDREIVDNLKVRQFTGYRRIADGTHRVGIWQGWASGVEPYRAFDFRFSERTNYTLLALDWQGQMQWLMLTDDLAAPNPGNAKLRFVNAGAFTVGGAVDVYVTAPDADLAGESADFTVIPFKGFTGYLQVPSGQYRVRVTLQGGKSPIADSGPIALSNAQIRTLVLVDNWPNQGFSIWGLADAN